MITGPRVAVVLAVGFVVLGAACNSSSSSVSSSSSAGGNSGALNGAGSTFAAPMYQQWAGEYHQQHPGVTINYQAIGSGGGISEFTQGIIDFGGTDAPMSTSEQTAAQAAHGGPVLHVPMILGSVVAIYHLPGVSGLKLDGPTLANIYLGKITKWNDRAIAKLNPGEKLPSAAIQVVQRADSSGTSFVWTSYLSAVSPAWASAVGANKAPSWPVGSGANGNSGVAAAVQQTTDAIGYVELGYATQAKIPYAMLKSGSGQWVTPSTASMEAAATGVAYPPDLKFSLIDSKTPGAYPVTTATWIVLAQHEKNASTGHALVSWMRWDLGSAAQGEVAKLGYAPLPTPLAQLALKALATITY
jgi:phosphate transport system substrate-binding protein